MRPVSDFRVRPRETPERMQRYARIALVLGLALLGLWILHDFLGAVVWAAILTVALWPTFERACRAWPGGRKVVWPALFTTVAGLVIHDAQMIPDPGQVFIFHGHRFQVLRRQRNQITALRVSPPLAEEAAA